MISANLFAAAAMLRDCRISAQDAAGLPARARAPCGGWLPERTKCRFVTLMYAVMLQLVRQHMIGSKTTGLLAQMTSAACCTSARVWMHDWLPQDVRHLLRLGPMCSHGA